MAMKEVYRSSNIVPRRIETPKETQGGGVIGDDKGTFTVKKGEGRRFGDIKNAIVEKFASIKSKFSGLIHSLKDARTARPEERTPKSGVSPKQGDSPKQGVQDQKQVGGHVPKQVGSQTQVRFQDGDKYQVEDWKQSKPDLSKAGYKPTDHDIIDPAHRLLRGGSVFGGDGMHKVAEHLIADAKNQANEINNKGGQTTWQQVLASRLTREMVQVEHGKTKEDAKATLDTLLDHFVVYEKASDTSEHGEIAAILRIVTATTTTDKGIVALARTAFTAELDKQLTTVDSFFRGTTMGTASASSVLRNLNTATTERVSESFADVLTDPKNKADVRLANSVPPSTPPTVEQMGAIVRLAEQFLDKAFGLSADQGKSFVENMDPRVVDFLKETTTEIQGKVNVGQNIRNTASQKWLSNGVALRDFTPVAIQIGRDLGLDRASSLVATMVLRVVGDVAPDTAVASLGEHNRQAYGDLLLRRVPQFLEMYTHLGLPLPN